MPMQKIDMDNGNFPLAKDALRVLAKTTLSGSHQALIYVVWMETYGWHDSGSQYQEKIKQRRIVAQISHKTFMAETWLDKTTVSRRLNELVDWGVIIRDKNTTPFTYAFNPKVTQWSRELFRDTTIARTVNSLQDSQQLANVPTNSLQDDQLGVDRTVNSLQAETLDTAGVGGSLNKVLNKSLKKDTSPNGDDEITEPDTQPEKIVANEQPKKKPKRKRKGTSPEAKSVAKYLKERLAAAGVDHVPRDWHLKNYATAERMIKSGVDPGELLACIDWLFADSYWCDKVTDLLVVERQYPKFRLQRSDPGGNTARGDPAGNKGATTSEADELAQYESVWSRSSAG